MSMSSKFFIAAGLGLGVLAAAGWRAAQPAGGAAAAPASAHNAAPAKIATVDVLSIVERLVDSDRYRPAREAFQKEQTDTMMKLRGEMGDLEARIRAMAESSPDRAPLIDQYQKKQEEQQGIGNRVEENNTRQIAEAYRLAIETASNLASRNGYTHVLASRTGPEYIRSTNVAGAIQEMFARPVLVMPQGDDLTQDVMKELKLDQPPAAPGGPGADKGAAPGTPPAGPASDKSAPKK